MATFVPPGPNQSVSPIPQNTNIPNQGYNHAYQAPPPPPAMYSAQTPGMLQMNPAMGPAVMNGNPQDMILKAYNPVHLTCHMCSKETITRVKKSYSSQQFMLCCIISMTGFICYACVPFLFTPCYTHKHYCQL